MSQSDKASSTGGFPWKELIVLLGVLISAFIGYLGILYQTKIPIHATQTAEARLTEFANFSNMTQPTILSSATWTPLPIVTESPTPIITATTFDVPSITLLRDDFIDNRNGWLIQKERGIESNIIGGKYKHTVSCLEAYESFYCGNYLLVPNLSSKDLQFELDATMKNISPGAEVMIAFQFRRNAGNYYILYFRSTGKYRLSIVYNGSVNKLLEDTTIPGFSPNTDTTNRYGFKAIGTLFKPLFK